MQNRKRTDPYQPEIHLTPQKGWMNDPNGFIYFKGKYHIFYQYYPEDIVWGPMHWGHAVSKDLIHWEYLPIALYPDHTYDRDGCFSGSAIEKDGKLFLIYTGHVIENKQKNITAQTQCLAWSEDGISFQKYDGNPVIPNQRYIEDMSVNDFRDPKIISQGDRYLCLVGSRSAKGLGQILVFESTDLIHWKYSSVLAGGDDRFGNMWECPDMFRVEENDVLIFSPGTMEPQGERFNNVSSSVWMTGDNDNKTNTFQMERYGEIDHGFDFYAPQTIEDPSGRRIMMAWLNVWSEKRPEQELHLNWAGTLAIPRELWIENGMLMQRPVRELFKYTQTVWKEHENLQITKYEKKMSLKQGEKGAVCFSGKIRIMQDTEIRIEIYPQQQEHALLTCKRKEACLRRINTFAEVDGERKTELKLKNEEFEFLIVADHSAVEIFMDNGRRVMSVRLYSMDETGEITISIEGNAKVRNLEYKVITEKK